MTCTKHSERFKWENPIFYNIVLVVEVRRLRSAPNNDQSWSTREGSKELNKDNKHINKHKKKQLIDKKEDDEEHPNAFELKRWVNDRLKLIIYTCSSLCLKNWLKCFSSNSFPPATIPGQPPMPTALKVAHFVSTIHARSSPLLQSKLDPCPSLYLYGKVRPCLPTKTVTSTWWEKLCRTTLLE